MNGDRKKKIWIGLTALALAAIVCVVFLIQRARRAGIGPEALRALAPVLQSEYKETVATIGGAAKSVYTSGCGAACVSMAIGYLTGDQEQTPETLFRWANENGYYFGDGLGHEALTGMAENWGLKGEWIENDAEKILSALKQGLPVIAHMGPGTFTKNGHYILLKGVDGEGKILVNDPGSGERSRNSYDLNLILREARGADSFMILSRGGL